MKSVINHRILSSAALFLFAASGILSAQTGKSYSQLKAEHPNWVQIPGKLMSPDCVHQVPNGARVEFGDNGEPNGDVTMNGQVIAHYDPCPEAGIDTRHLGHSKQEPGAGSGWVETSQWELSLGSSDNIDYMFGYWYVPSAPKDNGALIYLWNGIEPTGGNWVLQPVLQYGPGSKNGGAKGIDSHNGIYRFAAGDRVILPYAQPCAPPLVDHAVGIPKRAFFGTLRRERLRFGCARS